MGFTEPHLTAVDKLKRPVYHDYISYQWCTVDEKTIQALCTLLLETSLYSYIVLQTACSVLNT